MSEEDMRTVIQHMDRLYQELYTSYEALREGDVMLQDRIKTYSEEAAERATAKATEEAAVKAKKEREDAIKNLKLVGLLSDEMIAQVFNLPVEEIRAIKIS
jgi:hypothetical protein